MSTLNPITTMRKTLLLLNKITIRPLLAYYHIIMLLLILQIISIQPAQLSSFKTSRFKRWLNDEKSGIAKSESEKTKSDINSLDKANTIKQQQQQYLTIPAANPNFEAAFQGECGKNNNSNPCEHICLDLHDGTYECSCFYGFTLAVDGYSCAQIAITTTTISPIPAATIKNNDDIDNTLRKAPSRAQSVASINGNKQSDQNNFKSFSSNNNVIVVDGQKQEILTEHEIDKSQVVALESVGNLTNSNTKQDERNQQFLDYHDGLGSSGSSGSSSSKEDNLNVFVTSSSSSSSSFVANDNRKLVDELAKGKSNIVKVKETIASKTNNNNNDNSKKNVVTLSPDEAMSSSFTSNDNNDNKQEIFQIKKTRFSKANNDYNINNNPRRERKEKIFFTPNKRIWPIYDTKELEGEKDTPNFILMQSSESNNSNNNNNNNNDNIKGKPNQQQQQL